MAIDPIPHKNNAFWYPKPSTRQSTSLLWKPIPVNVTLATPGTAENLYLISTVDSPTVNLITNPSMETADPPTGFTAVGATLSRSNTVALNGTYSMLIDPDNAAAGEGAYFSLGTYAGRLNQPLKLSCSAYFQNNGGAASDARVRLWGSTSGFVASGNTIALDGTWQRSVLTYDVTTSETWRVYFVSVTQHNINYYADSAQAEFLGSQTSYCDGSVSRWTRWDGTAHASMSYRLPAPSAIHGFTLNTSRDVYIDYDNTATTSSRLVKAGSTWWNDHPVSIHRISMLNRWSGEQPQVWGECWGVVAMGDDLQE